MRIATRTKRTIALSSLRPGDWVETAIGSKYVIRQNWNSIRKVEVWWDKHDGPGLRPGVEGNVFSYANIIEWGGDTYIGRGQKRVWRDMLPRWAKRYVAPYSKP